MTLVSMAPLAAQPPMAEDRGLPSEGSEAAKPDHAMALAPTYHVGPPADGASPQSRNDRGLVVEAKVEVAAAAPVPASAPGLTAGGLDAPLAAALPNVAEYLHHMETHQQAFLERTATRPHNKNGAKSVGGLPQAAAAPLLKLPTPASKLPRDTPPSFGTPLPAAALPAALSVPPMVSSAQGVRPPTAPSASLPLSNLPPHLAASLAGAGLGPSAAALNPALAPPPPLGANAAATPAMPGAPTDAASLSMLYAALSSHFARVAGGGLPPAPGLPPMLGSATAALPPNLVPSAALPAPPPALWPQPPAAPVAPHAALPSWARQPPALDAAPISAAMPPRPRLDEQQARKAPLASLGGLPLAHHPDYARASQGYMPPDGMASMAASMGAPFKRVRDDFISQYSSMAMHGGMWNGTLAGSLGPGSLGAAAFAPATLHAGVGIPAQPRPVKRTCPPSAMGADVRFGGSLPRPGSCNSLAAITDEEEMLSMFAEQLTELDQAAC